MAVATIAVVPPLADLYSVGVVHGHRRHGLGRSASALAVDAALPTGNVAGVFLLHPEETQPTRTANSVVEEIYTGMGFTRRLWERFS